MTTRPPARPTRRATKPAAPATAAPAETAPAVAQSVAEPATAKSAAVKSDTVKSDTAKPDMAKPDTAHPAAAKPAVQVAAPVSEPPRAAPAQPAPRPASVSPAPRPASVSPAPRLASSAAMGEVAQAFVESAGTIARGWNELSQLASDSMRGAVEMGLAAGRAAIGTRTPTDLIEIQRGYLRDSFDRAMTDGTRMTELSVRIASDALAPLQARAGALFGRVGGAN